VSRTLQTDEFRDVFEVLTENEVIAFGYDRNVAYAELQQAVASAGVVQDVHGFEIDAFTRKKLFRPQTAASARLSEKREFFRDGVHVETPRKMNVRLLPRCAHDKAAVLAGPPVKIMM
jgi:hypothetical protein